MSAPQSPPAVMVPPVAVTAGGPCVVIGVDISLTGTALAVLWAGDTTTYTISSKPPKTDRHPRTGKPLPPTLGQRHARLYDIASQVLVTVENVQPRLIVIEQPAYSKSTGSNHDRSGLWWMLVNTLKLDGRTVVEVAPTCRAKYATGKGNASKDSVLAAVVRRYPDIDVQDNNQADATVLVAMGARHLGHPVDDLPKVQLEAMDAIVWPERIAR